MTAVFVDTNVLVHRFDTSEPFKHERATLWLDRLWRDRLGRISSQVLHELYATFTRKLGVQVDDARRVVRALSAWQPLVVDREVVERAWSLEDRFSVAWWDALIVAAAQGTQASILLTEDLQHGQLFDGVRVVSPFATTPEAILG